jgi:hypothetical protein
MSYVIAAPEIMTAAAADLATVGSNLGAAHAAAAPALAVAPAAADEVSLAIAQLFSQHGQDYQALAVQTAVFHEQFTQNLAASAASYDSIEAAIASLVRELNVAANSLRSAAINSTSQSLNAYFQTLNQLVAVNPLLATLLFSGTVIPVGLFLALVQLLTWQPA